MRAVFLERTGQGKLAEAKTVYGKLGVKCWICKGETKQEKAKAPETVTLGK